MELSVVSRKMKFAMINIIINWDVYILKSKFKELPPRSLNLRTDKNKGD